MCENKNNVSGEAKYQIFISSTYLDLVEERQHVMREILRAEQFPVAMENFVASDKSQWKIIERFIKNSGCLILILGERYGTVDEEDKKSVVLQKKNLTLHLNKKYQY